MTLERCTHQPDQYLCDMCPLVNPDQYLCDMCPVVNPNHYPSWPSCQMGTRFFESKAPKGRRWSGTSQKLQQEASNTYVSLPNNHRSQGYLVPLFIVQQSPCTFTTEEISFLPAITRMLIGDKIMLLPEKCFCNMFLIVFNFYSSAFCPQMLSWVELFIIVSMLFLFFGIPVMLKTQQ